MIRLTDYDPAYPGRFTRLQSALQSALGDLARSINHVGSTAVPGLSGKPILDIIVEIDSVAGLDEVVEKLKTLGYEFQGDLGIKDRYAFRRLDQTVPWDGTDAALPVHYLYVCPKGAVAMREQIAFRDALRGDAKRRDAYALLKKELSRNSGDDRKAYSDGKTALVKETLSAAKFKV